MPEALAVESASVLNGKIQVGDQVAIGVRDGSSGGIRLGHVVAIKVNEKRAWNWRTKLYDIPVYSVQVKVTDSSEYRFATALADAKPRWYSTDNMVRVG